MESQCRIELTKRGPSDDKEITSVYAADSADVDEAVKAARAAFYNSEWSDLGSLYCNTSD